MMLASGANAMMTHPHTCDSANRPPGIIHGHGTVPPLDERGHAKDRGPVADGQPEEPASQTSPLEEIP